MSTTANVQYVKNISIWEYRKSCGDRGVVMGTGLGN